jgi:hypothetical protein
VAAALRGTLFAGLLGVAIVASEILIYQPLMDPRFLVLRRSDSWDWYLVLLGPLAICVVVAMLARSIVELLSFAFIGALIVESLIRLAYRLKLRGHHLIEGGPIDWLAHYLVLVVALLGIVGALYLVRMGWRRFSAS